MQMLMGNKIKKLTFFLGQPFVFAAATLANFCLVPVCVVAFFDDADVDNYYFYADDSDDFRLFVINKLTS